MAARPVYYRITKEEGMLLGLLRVTAGPNGPLLAIFRPKSEPPPPPRK